VVDRQAGERADRVDHRLGAVAERGVDLRPELTSAAMDGHVEVAREAQKDTTLLGGDELGQDDRVRALPPDLAEPGNVVCGRETFARVASDDKDVQGLPRPGLECEVRPLDQAVDHLPVGIRADGPHNGEEDQADSEHANGALALLRSAERFLEALAPVAEFLSLRQVLPIPRTSQSELLENMCAAARPTSGWCWART
jgi:hypothetical protein